MGETFMERHLEIISKIPFTRCLFMLDLVELVCENKIYARE